ncbi:hypothetical protein [Halobellus captivus]|uniref:hypothetical protein n=1 Tax=Halobellus captivus TaxID=2592614 RepID=UPI00119ED5A4|nr:hypothetical protein [Halobellus captivus]
MTTDYGNVGGVDKTPDTAVASTTNHGTCEKRGREVAGISADAPGRRTLEPCGHETGFLRASTMYGNNTPTSEGHSLRADGRGAPLTYDKPTRRRDRAASHWCERVGSRVFCLKEQCGHCGGKDGEQR